MGNHELVDSCSRTVESARVCPNGFSYLSKSNLVLSDGEDYLSACQAVCTSSTDCEGFDIHKSSNNCRLYSSIGDVNDDTAIVSDNYRDFCYANSTLTPQDASQTTPTQTSTSVTDIGGYVSCLTGALSGDAWPVIDTTPKETESDCASSCWNTECAGYSYNGDTCTTYSETFDFDLDSDNSVKTC